jgi:predicted O-methyltransferase YrrM
VTTSMEEYMTTVMGGEDPLLRELRDDASSQGIPDIQVPIELGYLLQTLIQASGTRRVLEMGTLFGYSSILMARALPEGGTITTLEANPKHASVARANFERAHVADRITILEGQALDVLPSLEGQDFDLIFIDADKGAYPAYLDWALRLSHPGTIIVADNVWHRGQVAEPAADDDGSQGLAQFNRALAETENLTTTVVPRLGGYDAASVSVVRGNVA